jgi:hypothetical protein
MVKSYFFIRKPEERAGNFCRFLVNNYRFPEKPDQK